MLLILVSKEDGETHRLNGRLLVTTTVPGDTDYHYVRSLSGSPLEFLSKAEGITLLGGQRYLIIHDDDRRLGEATDGSTRRALKRPLTISFNFLMNGLTKTVRLCLLKCRSSR